MANSYEDFVAGYGSDSDTSYKDFVSGYKFVPEPLPVPVPVQAVPERPEGGFTAAFKQSLGSQAAGMGQLTEDVGLGASALKKWGEEYQAANPTAIHSWEDIKASPWLATKEAVGGAAGFMAPMIAGSVVGAGLKGVQGVSALARAARGVGAITKAAAPITTAAAPSYGGIRAAQIGADSGSTESWQDKLLALGAAGTVGAIETKFGPQEWALKSLSKAGRASLAGKFGEGSLLKRVGVGVGKGAAIEGAEELVQSPIEQLASYQDPRSAESLAHTGFGVAMGALGGGVMGGWFGAISGRKKDLTKPPPPPEVEPLAEPGAAIQPRSALQEQIDLSTGVERNEYQSEMEAAMNQVIGSVGSRNVTAWEQHVAAFPDLFAKKPKAKPVVPEKGKPAKLAEDPLVAAAPTKAGKKAVADYNQRLSTGQITQQQHEDLVSAIHGDTEVAKVNQALRRILKENKSALQIERATREVPPVGEAGQVVTEGGVGVGQVQQGAEVAQAGEAQEKIAPVTVTTPEGVSVVQPKVRKGDRSRKAEVSAALRPVATDPVPTVPADYEDAPAYEAAVMKYVVSGIPQNEWLAVARVRAAEQEGGEVTGESFEAAAKVLGVSKTAVRSRFNKGLSKMKANARAANLDWDTVAELLNITPPQAEAVSIGEAGQEGGMRAAVAPSEEFEPAYGMERGETTGEEGAVLEEGEAAELGVEEAEIDATSALLESQIADASERALAAYPVEYVQMAEAIWGKGFNDMPGFAQARFVRDVANMARSSDGDVDAFEAGIDRLKGERDGKKYTYDLAETVSGRDEVAARKPESTGRGGRGDVESGVVTGAKGAAGVKVEIKKRRVIQRSEITSSDVATGNTVASVTKALRKVFFSPKKMDAVVRVVQSEQDLPESRDGFEEIRSSKGVVQGFYDGEVAWLIAKNIDPGAELAVVLHEVGVHMGMKTLLGQENYKKLTDQVKVWQQSGKGQAGELARKAGARVAAAQKTRLEEGGPALTEEESTEEMLAYFVEEAVQSGINPTSVKTIPDGMSMWFTTLVNAFRSALRKLGINPAKLTAQDVVDLAYGAANMEMRSPGAGGGPGAVARSEVAEDTGTTTRHFKTWDTFYNALPHIERTHEVTDKQKRADGSWDITTKRRATKAKSKSKSMFSIRASEASIVSAVREMGEQRGVWASVGAAFDKFLSDPVNMLKVHGLGWLSLSHLVEVSQRVNPEIAGYRDAMQAMQNTEKRWVQKAAKIDVAWGSIKDHSQTKALHEVMRESTREGFDPSDAKAVPADAAQRATKSKYAKLNPDAKKVYADARDHYAEVRRERQTIMTGAVEAAFKNRIAEAKKAGDAKALAKYEKRMADEVSRLGTMYASVKGPYFPMMRLGEWYAVGMSKELTALMDKTEPTDADEKRISTLRKDPKHYRTKSFDRQSQAKAETAKMEKEFAVARYNVASERNQATSVLSAAGLKDVEDYITSTFDSKVAGEIKDMMSELYYQSLPENSVLKREMRREGVHGEEEDMRRVFAVSSLRNAHYLSRMKHADTIKSTMYAALQTGKRNGPEAMQMYNESAKRAKIAMEQSNTPIADLLTTGSYLAHLGMSPAFMLTNATQVPMIAMPWLAARSNPGTAASAISTAYKKSYNIIKSSYSEQGWRAELDWSGKVTSGEGKMLAELLERNLLNITMEHDLGVVAAGKRYTVGGKDVSIGDAMKIGNLPIHITELANRSVTALAAYSIAMAKPGATHEKAVEFAASAVSDTQLDYSALNAPRHMQRVGGSAALAKIVMQFRRYQQGMLWLICKNVYDGLISKNATSEEKREAKRTLFGLFTTTGIMAGTTGLPMFGTATFAASMIAAAFGDEDEPWDAEVEYRNWLTEMLGKDGAEAVSKGLPAWLFNADLSKRVGLGDIASPLPFARQGKTTKDTAANTLLAMAGAPVATVVDIVDGVSMMSHGDWMKGAEKAIPLKLAQNVVKASRYEYEGMSKANGEIILPPDKFSAADIMLRGVGISTATESDYYEGTQAIEKAKAAAKDVRIRLIAKFVQAKMAGEPTADIRSDIQEFNKRHPQKGVRIDRSSLIKSEQARRRAARERSASGVSTSKANKPYLSEAEFAVQ